MKPVAIPRVSGRAFFGVRKVSIVSAQVGISAVPLIQGWEREPRRAVLVGRWLERFVADQTPGHTKGLPGTGPCRSRWIFANSPTGLATAGAPLATQGRVCGPLPVPRRPSAVGPCRCRRRSISDSRLADFFPANALLGERLREAGIDNLCKTAQLPLDDFGLANQGGQDAVLRSLLVEEVMAENFIVRLQLAVDAAVALLHAAGIPGNVEVEQVPAMGLQVQALAGGVRGDENSQRMLGGLTVKGLLDGFSLIDWRGAVIDGDALVGAIRILDGARQVAGADSVWCHRTP